MRKPSWKYKKNLAHLINIYGLLSTEPHSKPLGNNERASGHNKISDILSKDLKKRGFKFVGSTIVYAHMQAIGMVNDHTIDCFRYDELTDH